MKKIRYFLKYIIMFFVLIIIYVILLGVTSLIPKEAISKNVEISSKELVNLGEKSVFNFMDKSVILFNFTDALMINTIYSIDTDTPLYSALTAKRNYIPGVTSKIYTDTKPEGIESDGEAATYQAYTYQTVELYNTVQGVDQGSIEYARYWHGYVIFLRPLLLLFSYNIIKIISAVIFVIISGILSYLLYKRINIFIAIAFFISLICTDVFIAGLSLNAITPFYIAVIFSIILVWKFEKIKDKFIVFFIIGSTTAFLDLLTTPLVTLGIPITIYFIMYQKYNITDIKELAIRYLKIVLAWGIRLCYYHGCKMGNS